MCLHHDLSIPLFSPQYDIEKRAQDTILYWEKMDKKLEALTTFWKDAIDISRKKDDNSLRKHFEDNFFYYYIDSSDNLL